MTAVTGPFVFTSDAWRDDFVVKAKAAGCRALAIQLGLPSSPAAAERARAAGLQVIGWGQVGTFTGAHLAQMKPDLWMPQTETGAEFAALEQALAHGVGQGLRRELVATSGGLDISGTDEQKVAERKRRREVLRAGGITTVWVEVYRQDADKHAQAHLGDVAHMCAFFLSAYGFDEAHPVIGAWTADDGGQGWARNPYRVGSYKLAGHDYAVGLWRAEQMADERYAELRTYIDSLAPTPPPVDVAANRAHALRLLEETVAHWRHTGLTEEQIAKQRQTLAWRVLHLLQSGENIRALRDALDRAGAPSP